MILVATTTSKIKLETIQKVFAPTQLIPVSTADANLPAQPINSGLQCCRERIDYVKRWGVNSPSPPTVDAGQHFMLPDVKQQVKEYDWIVSIENGIDTIHYFEKGGDHGHFVDICYVVLEDRHGRRYEASSFGIPIPIKFVDAARAATSSNYRHRDLGFEVTAGSMIHQLHPNIPADNWMADSLFGACDRRQQIEDGLINLKRNADTK